MLLVIDEKGKIYEQEVLYQLRPCSARCTLWSYFTRHNQCYIGERHELQI